MTPIDIKKAIKTGRLKLLQKTDDWFLTMLNDKGSYPIHYASKYGQLSIIRHLVKKEPSLLNLPDKFSNTALHFAAREGHLEVVQYLLKEHADPNTKTIAPNHGYDGYLPIHWATLYGYHEIVDCLIQHESHKKEQYDQMQSHLIHIASTEGHLKVVEILLANNPNLLNLKDVNHQTPLFLAIANGHFHVAEILIAANVVLKMTAKEDHKDDIILIMEVCYGKDNFLSCIKSGAQAAQFMKFNDAFTPIFLNDERVSNLITRSAGCSATEESAHCYITAGRKPSWFLQVDLQAKTSSVYEEGKVLGEGKNGIVRSFINNNGKQKVVKSPKGDKKLTNEAWFNKQVYAEHDTSLMCEFEKTNRYLMKHVKGHTAFVYMLRISCPYELTEIILNIAQELQRFHDIGIIHGDLSPFNVMIDYKQDAFIVRLIDFGCSSKLTDDRTIIFRKGNQVNWHPPELIEPEDIVKPHPSQDVYSLGFSLQMILNAHPLFQELMQLSPCIMDFMVNACVDIPSHRPSLASFIAQLRAVLSPIIESSNALTNRQSEKVKKSALTIHHFLANSQPEASPDIPESRGCCVIS